jgi:hypothetical protein
MPKTSTSRHLLTDQKFKDVTKGIHRRLCETIPQEYKPPINRVRQALSQELFSMPYEEAKKTLLSKGEFILPAERKEKPDHTVVKNAPLNELNDRFDGIIDNIMRQTDFEGATNLDAIKGVIINAHRLNQHVPLSAFPELWNIKTLIKKVDEWAPGLLPIVAKNGENGSNIWEGRAAIGLEAHAKAFFYQTANKKGTVLLKNYREHISSLASFVELSMNESIPKSHRAGLWSMLSSINYKHATESMPSPKQNPTTEEQYEYMMMEQLLVIDRLSHHMKILKKQDAAAASKVK